MKMKRLLSVVLSATMAVSVVGTVLPAFALEGDGLEVSAFQTSSNSDIGIDADNVRFAWNINAQERGVLQTHYSVIVKDTQGNPVWESGWVESDDQSGITPKNLKPETVYTWQVNIRDQHGHESGFSEPETFETAPEQLNGNWIGSGYGVVRKTFQLDQPLDQVDRARAYMTSTSMIETRMNGQKVGEWVLGPKKPVPDVRVYYNTYDIKPYLLDGENTAGIMLGNVTPMGGKTLGTIKIYYKDGSVQEINTGTDWRGSTSSPVTRATFETGEDQNPNLMVGWDTNDYVEDNTWSNARICGSTSMYCEDGKLVVPANAGTYYTNQSFSGNYTIETKVSVQQNAFGLVFGSGNPNGALWQFNVIEGNLFKVHNPGNWSTNQSYVNDQIQYNQDLIMKVKITGNTVESYLGDTLIDTRTFEDGQTAGKIGFRSTVDEAFTMDYLKVTDESGNILFEDHFDKIDSNKWNVPADPIVEPAVSATKVIKEVEPVSIQKVTKYDKSKPYAADGQLYLPRTSGEETYYTNQSFSGDYTIETEVTVKNTAFGLLFGSGNPNGGLWQFNVAEGNVVKTHQPGDWSQRDSYPNAKVQYDTPLKMKIEVKGNEVKTYLEDELICTNTFADGQTSGRLGLRAGVQEEFSVNYIRVSQNGEVIWSDEFDSVDTTKWNFPEPGEATECYVVDFGKNMSGYARLNVKGQKDDVVTLRYAELQNDDGSIYANTTYHFPYNNYTLTGGNDTFEPKFFSTGFRYVEVENFPGELTAENITACFVSDDIEETGSFTSSNDRLNKIYDMYHQSQLSNLVGNYTDCPQREKDGWTGDASVIKEAASMMLADYNSAEAYMKTMYDNIYPDGQPLVRVPKPASMPQGTDEYGYIDPTWTSAYFVFPYQTYMQTGDSYYIEMAYPSMMEVFQFYQNLDTDHDYIITNNTFGDWLGYDNQNGKVDRNWLSASYVYYSGVLLSEMAEIIGEDHTELDAYLENMNQAIQAKFNQGTYYSSDTQTANAMAVDLGIVAEQDKDTIVQSILNNVSNANTTLMTGVLGTKSIYDTLSEANQHKVLLDLTTTPEKCSFGYMLDNGATTLWEYWDKAGETFNSNNPPGENRWDSQNHAMMGGGLGAWVYEGLGGITATGAGYEEIIYRPGIESELEYVDTSIDTLKGLAESNWDIVDGDLVWDVTVPANSTATIKIPMKDAKTITESGNDIFQKDGNGITYVGQEENGDYVYTVGSGSYHFVASEQGSVVEESDKDILNKVITYAEEQKASDDFNNVIKDVQETFNAALDAAKEVAADPAATQDAVDAAWKTLMTEIHKLGFVKGDITSLETLVALSEGYDMNDYVEAGQAEFKEALKAAQELLANKDNAMQTEIETAENNLLNAMLNLRYKADKSILEKVIAEANSKDASAYTEESYAALQAAVKDANDVMADENVTQKEVDTAVTNVQTAMDQLVAVDGSIPEETTPSTNDTATQTGQESTTKANAAKTGDVAPIAGLIVLAAAGATAIGAKKRKK
ncbi:family 78 glycoside hydrolase catalytic domain [Clostridium facile]|uniref:alpha-L-rhamnosidase n=1 Tax=Clostridium facile TaxID=2763035 RepID=A0ABR7INQ2_9CLOT|nr:family 78 glycoside hydrolase catalytic domain [Clostridium facile]MBC5786704.1 family 78 glycoside hydrolase catalytic domain [Clostridium facile]